VLLQAGVGDHRARPTGRAESVGRGAYGRHPGVGRACAAAARPRSTNHGGADSRGTASAEVVLRAGIGLAYPYRGLAAGQMSSAAAAPGGGSGRSALRRGSPVRRSAPGSSAPTGGSTRDGSRGRRLRCPTADRLSHPAAPGRGTSAPPSGTPRSPARSSGRGRGGRGGSTPS
jgi:hypothetical protein